MVAVGLPAGCPGCGGELMVERVAAQSVEELPVPRPLRIRYDYIIVAAIAQRGPFRSRLLPLNSARFLGQIAVPT